MSRDDIQKLLGGYATNTLSEAERQELLEAALDDQQLFDALAKEQALRDVLDDPAARRQLIAALAPTRSWAWLRRPAALAMAAGFAALVIVSVILVRPKPSAPPPPRIVAEAIPPRPAVPLPEAEATQRELSSLAKKTKTFAAPAAISASRPTAAPPAPLTPPTLPPAGENVDVSAAAPILPAPSPTPPPAVRLAAGQAIAGNAVTAGQLRAFAAKALKPGLEYVIMLAHADGTYSPLPDGTVLHAGDSVRLQIASPFAGTLSLYQYAPNGDTNLLSSQPVEKDHSYILPQSGAIESDQPAQLRLRLVLTPAEPSIMRFSAGRQSNIPGPTAAVSPVRNITLEFQSKP